MPKLFPDIDNTRINFASAAEHQFYLACKEQLSEQWQVFYSCTLSSFEDDKGLLENEIDFFLYHPKWGGVAIEVKGGRIGFDATTREYVSTNRHGDRFVIKDPFTQAMVWKNRFLRYLKKQNCKIPISHAVYLPSINEGDFPSAAANSAELLIGRNRIQTLEQALENMIKLSHPERYLHFPDIAKKLEKILLGSNFSAPLFIRDYIDNHESRLKDLQVIQETLLGPIANSSLLAIEGEAGTGKTMLAVMLAKKYHDLGEQVLLLTTNELLNNFLRQQTSHQFKICTYNELALEFDVNLLIPASDFKDQFEYWLNEVAPQRFLEQVNKSDRRYDVIICDESQDVEPKWWPAIKQLLRSDQSRFYIFFDRSQGVFGLKQGKSHFDPQEIVPIKPPYFPLVHNYRTTREIAEFSRFFRTGQQILQSHSSRIGYVPQIITYTSVADCQKKLSLLVEKLCKQELANPNEITLLSARRLNADDSVLKDLTTLAQYSCFHFSGKNNKNTEYRFANVDEINVSTIGGFKGLETKIGILLNLSEYNLPIDHPFMKNLIYVAATRAKHMLYIFVKQDDPKCVALKKALQQISQSGAMIINNQDQDHSACGIIVHYNPLRIGWISIEEQGVVKNNIMFFPHDVAKADITDLKVGQRVKFRCYLEGQMTIAADLELVE